MARTMGDASKVAVAGGDGSNLYYFYTGSSSYKDNSIENIAAFAQQNFDSCKGKSVEDIESKHIFWGTEGGGYKGFYNGDTYVLFDDVEKLPEDVKQDALKYCKGYREAEKKEEPSVRYVIKDRHGNQMSSPNADDNELWDRVESRDPDGKRGLHVVAYTEKDVQQKDDAKKPSDDVKSKAEGIAPSEFDPVKIKYIADSCVEQKVGKDGSPYYRIGVSVGKSFSENGFANINVRNGVEKRNNVWSVDFPDNKMINMDIVQEGKHKRVSMAVSDLADAHAEQLAATKGQRRLPHVPEVAEDDKSLQME